MNLLAKSARGPEKQPAQDISFHLSIARSVIDKMSDLILNDERNVNPSEKIVWNFSGVVDVDVQQAVKTAFEQKGWRLAEWTEGSKLTLTR